MLGVFEAASRPLPGDLGQGSVPDGVGSLVPSGTSDDYEVGKQLAASANSMHGLTRSLPEAFAVGRF